MNTALLMLGSNLVAFENITEALKKLEKNFELGSRSSTIISQPEGKQYANEFMNLALKISTDKTKVETIIILKQIEKALGRTPESKITGQIPIDIDLISWNNIIEHQDYNRFQFVRDCIDEIK